MPELHVVMYHYVRDPGRTRFPKIHAMPIETFRRQIDEFAARFEMATLESALAFLHGDYLPNRDLCMLTFDDGLKEHFTHVLPELAARRIQGLFGVITDAIENRRVAAVHMNHFLTAALPFDEYRTALEAAANEIEPSIVAQTAVDADEAVRSYPLDTPEMARFKLLLNFKLPAIVRDEAIRSVFVRHLGDEASFAGDLYMNWLEVRELQSAGMLVAGHTHWHRPLATLDAGELRFDLATSRALMDQRLYPQSLWPFSYPYGKRNSYSGEVISELHANRFDCAFGTEPGSNTCSTPLFELHRIDCKNALDEI